MVIAEATLVKNAGHYAAGYTDFPESFDDYIYDCQRHDGLALPLFNDEVLRIPRWSHPDHLLGKIVPDMPLEASEDQAPMSVKAPAGVDALSEIAITNTLGLGTTDQTNGGKPTSADDKSLVTGFSLKAATSHITKRLRQIFTRVRTTWPY